MDNKLILYQTIVGGILKEMSTRIAVNKPHKKKHLIINAELTEYMLVSLGRSGNQYDYTVLVHLELKKDKVYIYEENIDPSLYERLTDNGIPDADILPVYMPEHEYA